MRFLMTYRKMFALSISACLLCWGVVLAKGKPGGGDGGPTAAEVNPAIAFVTTQKNGRQDVVVASADLSSEIVLTNSLQLGGNRHVSALRQPGVVT